MRIKFTALADGPGPSETVVGIRTTEGHQEEVVLSKRLADRDGIDIGNPLLQEEGKFLVELPRETTSGRWRIWVPSSEVVFSNAMQPAE